MKNKRILKKRTKNKGREGGFETGEKGHKDGGKGRIKKKNVHCQWLGAEKELMISPI